jgi:catechol 2,3-dioxygenase-like lactoylglutathione lyase family enzyme
MVRRFDHMTLVVRELEPARRFFGLLGFREAIAVVIAGEPFAAYMGVPGIEADHVTLVLEGAPSHTEIQLLHYRNPPIPVDAQSGKLDRTGFNHVCFAVDDIEAEIETMRQAGFTTRSEVLDFHARKLVFLRGPENVVVELSQWTEAPPETTPPAETRSAAPQS